MNPDVVVGTLLIIGAVVWLGVPAFLAGCVLRERRDDRAQPEDEGTTAEWLALLAAVDGPAIPAPRRPADLSAGVGWARESSPIRDRLVCESIEREEGWA